MKPNSIATLSSLFALITLGWLSPTQAQDWARFRGPNGSGTVTTDSEPPTTWSSTENMKWKVELPGPGHSSPIVVGEKIFLTCWTGYGVNDNTKQEDLQLHLLCYDRQNGKQLWGRAIQAKLPVEVYGPRTMIAEHGYASHTPVSDGQHVWAFFGKTGVICFDVEGNEKWRKSLGERLNPKKWGSSSSPILHNDLLIVTAAIESKTLFGLNKLTGEEVWSVPADGFALTWGTPVLTQIDENRTDLVISVPYEIWGFDPDTGKFRWYCESLEGRSACTSVVADDMNVYLVESGGSMAIAQGGKDDVTASGVKWRAGDRNRIGSPIVYKNRLYWIANNIAKCISTEDGSSVYETRLERPKGQSKGARSDQVRGNEYSSAIAINDKLYFVNRQGEMYVLELGDEFKQIAVNVFEEGGDFSATPAFSNGELFVRSTKMLYCIAHSDSSQPKQLSGNPIQLRVLNEIGGIVLTGKKEDVDAIAEAFEKAAKSLKEPQKSADKN